MRRSRLSLRSETSWRRMAGRRSEHNHASPGSDCDDDPRGRRVHALDTETPIQTIDMGAGPEEMDKDYKRAIVVIELTTSYL